MQEFMQEFLKILLASGQKGFELAFFILMPIMVLMMAIMRVLDQKGVLRRGNSPPSWRPRRRASGKA
jgi:spore maturation protein SpmA